MNTEKHYICKEDLLDTILGHFGVDLAYLDPDLQYCQEAIDLAPVVDVVPIPCKLGQTIYEVVLLKDKRVSHINPMTVVGIHAGDFPDLRGHKRKSYLVVTHPTSELLGRVPFEKIGKTVFMTKEDAERAAYPCEHCASGSYRSCAGCSYGERRSHDDTTGT